MSDLLSDHFRAYAYAHSGEAAKSNYHYLLEQLERLERNHARLLSFVLAQPFCFTDLITDWEDEDDQD